MLPPLSRSFRHSQSNAINGINRLNQRKITTQLVKLTPTINDKKEIKSVTQFCMSLPNNTKATQTQLGSIYVLPKKYTFDATLSKLSTENDPNELTPLETNDWFKKIVATILLTMRPNQDSIPFIINYMLNINSKVPPHRDKYFDTCVIAMGLFQGEKGPLIPHISDLNLLIEDPRLDTTSGLLELPQTPPGNHYVLFEGFRCLHYTKNHNGPTDPLTPIDIWRPQLSIHIKNEQSIADDDL